MENFQRKLCANRRPSYDPRKEIGVLQYPWTDGVSERYNEPSQIATSISTAVGVQHIMSIRTTLCFYFVFRKQKLAQ